MNENNEPQNAIVAPTLKFSPAVFDPNKEQLEAIAESVKGITADPEKITKEELAVVNETKNKLVKARTAIKRIGKATRDEANQFSKDVIAYEKELIAIIEPEEIRIKEIEQAAKDLAIKKEREKTLPEFKEKLTSINDGIETDESITNEFLLSLDPNQRDAYYNERLAAKNEADREALRIKEEQVAAEQKAAQDKIDAEKAEIEREKRHAQEVKEAEERAKKEAENKAKQEAAAEEAKRKAEEKAAQEEKEKEAARLAKEKEARKASEAYQEWLSEHSYDEKIHKIIEKDGTYTLYQWIGSYTPE